MARRPALNPLLRGRATSFRLLMRGGDGPSSCPCSLLALGPSGSFLGASWACCVVPRLLVGVVVTEPLVINLDGVGAIETYEEHVMAWHHLDGVQDELNWFRGALAASVEIQYGEARLERFAQDVGRSYSAVASYRQVFQEFETSTRIEFPGLKWYHYRFALEAPGSERFALLEEAATTPAPKSEKLPWPVRELKQVIKERWPAPRPLYSLKSSISQLSLTRRGGSRSGGCLKPSGKHTGH